MKNGKGHSTGECSCVYERFTGNLKLIGTEKSEVRGLEERTLLKKEEGLRVEGEIGWVLCGLPSFLSS